MKNYLKKTRNYTSTKAISQMSPESTQKKFCRKWVDVRGRQGNIISEDHDTNRRLKSNHSRDGDTLS